MIPIMCRNTFFIRCSVFFSLQLRLLFFLLFLFLFTLGQLSLEEALAALLIVLVDQVVILVRGVELRTENTPLNTETPR